MTGCEMKNAVEEYIERQKLPQREILRELRRVLLQTLPHCQEELLYGVPWFDKKFYLVAFKDHVNIGFSVKGLTEKEKSLFEGKGKFMTHIKIWSFDGIDEERIVRLLRLVSEKNGQCRKKGTR